MFDKKQYDSKYRKTYFDQISFNVRKDSDIKERLKVLSIGTHKTITELIIEALELLFAKYNA